MMSEEEYSAPVSRSEIDDAISHQDSDGKKKIVETIMRYLNEKRDAYSGIISSIKYLVGSKDEILTKLLQDALTASITSYPMQYGGKMFIAKAVHRLSSERPEFIASLFEKIIETTSDWSARYMDQKEVLKLQISSLKAIRKAEQVNAVSLTNLTLDFTSKLCDEAIVHGDDATKLDTLVLILESRSSTRPLPNKDLISFERLFHDALSLQEPAQRQIFVSQTSKLILRIRDSHRAVMRDRKKYTDDDRKNVHHHYTIFLTRLINFCFDSIYCNAYFGSFILTISTLKLILKHITLDHKELPIRHLYSDRRCYDSVLSCLSDSFEENKSMALDLFFSLPECREAFADQNLQALERIAYQLVESVNPAHALTCLYVFKLVIGLKTPHGDKGKVKNQVLYQQLCKLMDLVDAGVEDTRNNFVKALKRNAIYPKLTCIRALLCEISRDFLEDKREEWTKLSSRIVLSSIAACHAVANVVCNLNPETIGHLPMDLKPVDIAMLAKALDVSTKISDDQVETVSSQMLLISGWKTIKECSLSMAAMCTNLWWSANITEDKCSSKPRPEPILNKQDIEKIISFFDHYLRNLRHRGAFEQAYNGFSVVASKIWQEEDLRSRLFGLLKQVMDDFKVEDSQVVDDKKTEYLKAYVTRRSAGLPFIVQAILSAEDKHDSRALRYVLDNLFEVLDRPTSEVYQRIHCLNILRAVIKDYHLGEKVVSYVGKTLDVTMDSFKSDSFPIRNCANMLLKSTIDRIFGVNRLRDDIHRKNQMSYEKFFSLCPTIHSKTLDILQNAADNRGCLASVHAVFIIMFRLRPRINPGVEFDADSIIKPYIEPLLDIVYGCPDFKIRELGAKLTIQLLKDYDILTNKPKFSSRNDMIQELKDIIYHTSPSLDRNRLHGALLLTKTWLDDINHCANEEIYGLHMDFINFSRSSVKELLLFVRPDVNCTIKCIVLDIAELINVIVPGQSAMFLDLYPRYKILVHKREGFAEPNYEHMIFKFTCNLLISALQASQREETRESIVRMISEMLRNISRLILQPSTMTISTNLQASLIRVLRQLMIPTSVTIDKLMKSLDFDDTAAFLTPVDKLQLMSTNDLAKEHWLKYCSSNVSGKILKEYVADFCKIFNFKDYPEFQLEGTSAFKSRYSNTPRSIELLALSIEVWDEFELEHNAIWTRLDEKTIDKVKYLTRFVGDLPDCDIKCLAILCLAKVLKVQLGDSSQSLAAIETLTQCGRLIEDLCDSDHSYLIRETCARALQVYIGEVKLIGRSIELRSFLISCLSTIIKLIQDEEHQIRILCKFTLIGPLASANSSSANRLNTLLDYITSDLFDPEVDPDVSDCFTLMMRIVFEHSKNYSQESLDKDERLFDKTKLNTFADHIVTIQSCFRSLQAFLDRRASGKINIEQLPLKRNNMTKLFAIDKSIDESCAGDYSWRKKKAIDTNQIETSSLKLDSEVPLTNHQLVSNMMKNFEASLDYFLQGYSTVLIDTEYSFHELSLFRRVSFLVFIFRCVDNTLECDTFKQRLLSRFKTIVDERCATTLICKCIEALQDAPAA